LCTLGFDAVGVDIAEPMISLARERDPNGEYLLVPDGDLSVLRPGTFDLVFSVFTFNNVPTIEKKVALFTSLKELLTPGGRIVSLVSTPDIYRNEWASFSTKDFPGNRTARSGKKVFTVMLDVDDRRPVTDFLGTDGDRYEVYGRAGLVPLLT
jgi:SAM-dependent methyltransferase